MTHIARAALLAFFAVSAVPASAQGITGSALKGLDSKAPIDVDADRIDVLDQQNQAIFWRTAAASVVARWGWCWRAAT